MNWKDILKMVGSASAGAAAQVITFGIQTGANPAIGAFWSGVGVNTGIFVVLTLLAHIAPSPIGGASATAPAPTEQPETE